MMENCVTEVMTDDQPDGILKMVRALLDGCKNLKEAKEKSKN